MNIGFKKISSVFLALLVTLSTFSFTVEKHFCGEFLVDVSYLGHAEGCDMDENSSAMKNCCDDQIVQIEGQDELQKITAENYQFPNVDFFTPTSFQNIEIPILYTQKTVIFEEYSPPEIIPDIQVLQEVFII